MTSPSAHALRRIMERFPGVCPGQVLADCRDLIREGHPPCITTRYSRKVYRFWLIDGRCLVVVAEGDKVVTVAPAPFVYRCRMGETAWYVADNEVRRMREK